MKKQTCLLLGLGAAAGLTWWILKSSRFDAEKTPYEMLRRDGDFELRRYPALPVASTLVSGRAQNDAFRRLFGFINGGNARREKMAMTTPVFFDGTPGAQERMSFVLPGETARDGVPTPSGSEVTLGERPAQRVAAYRFSGATRAESERHALSKLRDWLRLQNLQPEGEPVIAYYDAPFIPGFLRRNEAMLRIAD